MSEPIDIAVDLGVIPPPIPEAVSLREMVEAGAPAPRQIIEGILHQGCKIVLGGTNKSNKTWALLVYGQLLPGKVVDVTPDGKQFWEVIKHRCFSFILAS